MDFGIGTVVAITVIVYLIGAGCKSVEGLNNKFIPVICGFSGAVLGVVGMLTMPDFPAKDILNAVAIGIVSGLASPELTKSVSSLHNNLYTGGKS